MDTKDLLKKVRKIEIKTRRLSDHIFGGEYHSTFKGKGMTFSEVRQYQIGDDVRTIDWNVTARYKEPYIKVFEEEREQTLMLMVDVSGSKFFGTNDVFKNEYVTEIAATLSFYFQDSEEVILLELDLDKVNTDKLLFEEPFPNQGKRKSAFPHLYSELRTDQIANVWTLERGAFKLPETVLLQSENLLVSEFL